MRSVFSLIALLIALLIVMLAFSKQAKKDVTAVKSVTFVQNTDTKPRPFDAQEAFRLTARLRQICDTPDVPQDELKTAVATAASWSAACPPGSPDYHTAVSLRSAANELLETTVSLEDGHRANARRFLDQAENPPGSVGARPRSPVDGIRDQMQNLQNQQRERRQENQPD